MPGSLDDYEVLSTIGQGSYGICKKIRRKKDGRILVWKKMDYGEMSESEKEMLVSEVNLLRELKHKRIVRYYDRIVDRANTCLYIIMEYCEGGDLASYIKHLKTNGGFSDEAFVWKMCVQMIQALKECHDRNKLGKAVLHRDLKPANVFLDANNNVKLGDFGLARVLNHDTSFAKTFVGTPYYMSPEQMNYMSYNEKSDIWSLACLLYELCALRPPFLAGNQKDLAVKICCGTFARLPLRYSQDLNNFLAYVLQVEGSKRPSIDDLLLHPLIVKKTSALEDSLQHMERLSLASSDEMLAKAETLKKMEDRLAEREERVKRLEEIVIQRELALDERERNVSLKESKIKAAEKTLLLKEKKTQDQAARAEKLIKEYTETNLHHRRLSYVDHDLASDSDLSGVLHSTPGNSLSPCLLKAQRPFDSPPKRVSFTPQDKENRQDRRYHRRPSKKHLLNLEQKFNAVEEDSEVWKRAALFRYPLMGDK